MSDNQRSIQDSWNAFLSSINCQYFDQWANTYNIDTSNLGYASPKITADVLKRHIAMSPEQVQVLDVACGTGLAAQKLSALGFRQFVGVDGNKAMLEKARDTELYQSLHYALLGTQPLPDDIGEFDVVMMVGGLYKKYMPAEVVRELCQAVKPGGLVVMTRTNYQTPENASYTEELHQVMSRMEEEGLWKLLEVQPVERNFSVCFKDRDSVPGTVHVYQKTLKDKGKD